MFLESCGNYLVAEKTEDCIDIIGEYLIEILYAEKKEEEEGLSLGNMIFIACAKERCFGQTSYHLYESLHPGRGNLEDCFERFFLKYLFFT